jgi:hypothetical protein
LERASGSVLKNICAPLATALICSSCATSDSIDFGEGGASFTGTQSLHYIANWSGISTRLAYMTGSTLPMATAPSSFEGRPELASSSGPTGTASVHGPAPVAKQLADTVIEAIELAYRWYPADFSDQFDVSIRLVADGDLRFSRRFILEASPWPMAFVARHDQVATQNDRAGFASTMAHEGYHLANSLSTTGQHLAVFHERPVAGLVYEETAARLLGDCVSLTLGHSRDLDRVPSVAISQVNPNTGEARDLTAPLPGDFVISMINVLSRPHEKGDFSGPLLYVGFYRTLFHHYAEGADVIEPGTPAAERLLAACDRVGPDVTQVPVELLAMAEDADDSGS